MDVFALAVKLQAQGQAQVEGALESVGKKLGLTSKAAMAAGAALTAGVAGAMALVLKNSMEAETSMAQLNATIKSTGGAAGFSASQIAGMAGDLQKVTAYGDDAIIAMQSVLLTFTKVRGNEFKDATASILDMATALKMDLKGAAIQVGKALNDPVAGVAALGRAGVQFSEDQKAMIASLVETGKQAEAQRLILKELEVQFGGSAKAARETMAGALQALNNAFGDLFENQRVIDQFRKVVEQLIAIVSSPRFASGMASLINGLSRAITYLETFGKAVAVLATLWATKFIPLVIDVILVRGAAAFFGLAKAMQTATVATWSLNTAMAALGKNKAILAIQVVVFALGAAWVKLAKDAADAEIKTLDAIYNIDEAAQGTLPKTTERVTDLTRAFMGLSKEQSALMAYQAKLQKDAENQAKKKKEPAVDKSTDAPYSGFVRGFGEIGRAAADFENQMRETAARQARERQPLELKVPVDPVFLTPELKKSLEDQRLELEEELRTSFGEAIGATLVDSISGGIERAVETGNIGEGFKTLGAMIVAGIGDAMVKAGLAGAKFAALMEKLQNFFALMNPGGALAVSLAMIAVGSALKGMARGSSGVMFGGVGGGGGGRSAGGGFAYGTGLGDTFTRLYVPPTNADRAAGVAPLAPVNVTVIGPNDPTAQRQIFELISKGARR
jgi:hypothetical protein